MADDFESMMRELQRISAILDEDGLSLKERVALYKKGVAQAKACLAFLQQTEHEITDISAEIEKMMKEGEMARDDRAGATRETEAHS